MRTNSRRVGVLIVVVAAATALSMTTASVAQTATSSTTGVVASGDDLLGGARVTVLQAGQQIAEATVLGSTTAATDGSFTVTHPDPADPDAILYLVADGGEGTRLASVLGTTSPATVVVNERTTVATAHAMAQFISGPAIGGPSPGMPNAAGTFANIVDPENGAIGEVLATSPNGGDTLALATVNSLANMLAACVRDDANCADLFALATPPDGPAPTNTLDAMVAIAGVPGANVPGLIDLAQVDPGYAPALPADAADPTSDSYVNALMIVLRYDGATADGPIMDGPGNIAFDSAGNAWVNNNYAYEDDRGTITCGSTAFVKLTPTGRPAPGAPFGGDDVAQDGVGAGGLYGAGFGMAIDNDDEAWITNFGFQGQPLIDNSPKPDCEQDAEALAVSASHFDSDGNPISPDGEPSSSTAGGYIVDGMGQPQGVLSDLEGDIWIAGCIDGTVTRFRGGQPDQVDHVQVDQTGQVAAFDNGFDVAIDGDGHAWFTGNKTSNVVEFDGNFQVVRDLKDDFDKPMGIAVDSAGNFWVANAGVPNPPCPPALSQDPSDAEVEGNGPIGTDGISNFRAAVTLIDTQGVDPTTTKFGKAGVGGVRDGLRWPWGIAVDGDDNVWVANFAGQTIMHLCGNDPDNCPDGVTTGDPLSPDSGYFSSALTRVTAVQVDPSGNVWLTNNWAIEGFTHPENPGGYQVVVYVGLAPPVVTPLLGPVRTLDNDVVLPEFTLVKEWVDGVDGDLATLDVTGQVATSATASAPAGGELVAATTTVLPGETIDLAETLESDNSGSYDATLACVGPGELTFTAGDTTGTFTVPVTGAGDVTCTFTNTRREVELVLDKEWVGGAAGDASTLTATSLDTVASGLSVATGTAGSEIDADVATATFLAGDVVTLEDVPGVDNDRQYDLTWSCDAGEVAADTGAAATLVVPTDVAAGDTVTCTATNTARASITVVKDAVPELDQDFTFTTTLPSPDDQFVLSGDPAGVTGWTSSPVPAGVSYAITETDVDGWAAAEADCDNGDDPTDIVPAAGATVTCTFVNVAQPGEVTVTTTATNVAAGTDWAVELAIDPVDAGVTSPQEATGTGDGSDLVAFAPLAFPMTYTLADPLVPAGWSVDSFTCALDDASVDEAGYQVVISSPGQSVACTLAVSAPSSGAPQSPTPISPGGSNPSQPVPAQPSGSLPHTGLELPWMAAVSVLLLLAGIGARGLANRARRT